MQFNPQTSAELISMIITANANPGPHTITLRSGGTYSITAVNHTTNGATGLPSITKTITIIGNGATIRRDGSTEFRLFHIGLGGELTLQGLTVQNGKLTGGAGGGLFNRAKLTSINVRLKEMMLVSFLILMEAELGMMLAAF